MNQSLSSLVVTPATTINEILTLFIDSQSDLLLIDENSVVADPHMELLTDYPRSASAALVAVEKNGDTLVRQNRIASASSASHKVTIGNRKFVGVLRLSQKQRTEIIAALENALTHKVRGNALDLVLVALTRAMIKVDAADVWAAPYIRSADKSERDQTQESIAKLNMGRVRLRMANRANDGFFSVFFLRKFSKILTWLAVKVGATPNQVTLISFAIGLYSAYSFSLGGFWNLFLGAVLLQLSIIVDCVDGELARYTRKFSQLGAWLDAVTDRVKEYMVFLGLAMGADKEGRDLWIPAIAMMLIQTFRHLSDYNYARVTRFRAEEKFLAPVEFTADFDGIVPTEREPKGRLRYWLGKIIQFPIGERWLAISASAVIGGAAFTFLLRLIEGGFLIWVFASVNQIGIPTFMILFSIVFHHYDNLYRALQDEKKPLWLSVLGLFVGGRILLLGVAALQDWPLHYFAWYFSILFLAISSMQWVLSHRANKIGR